MKKILLYLATAMLATSVISAKTIDEIRIYLNPGHGSWGPNDRPMSTIPYPKLANGMPDTCGFFESNTNLWKVLKLGNTLEKMGVKKENIMYSRVKNGPYPYVANGADATKYNRSLSEICTEVEANNIDIFLSVHSNANVDGDVVNYPLFLYRGKDGADGNAVDGSYDMAHTMWPMLYDNGIDFISAFSSSKGNIRGDIDFYGKASNDRVDPNTGKTYTGYLGVLKHGAQGFLSEGYFHTYQPARHRALNKDYCGQEGVRYARGLCQWLGGKKETTGYIMGTVKDLHEKMSHDLFNYAPNSIDQWKPINGATVTLYKDGNKVTDYTTDNNYNGVFVFEGLAPGNYTLDVSAEGYRPLFDEYKEPITVTANETTYPLVYLEATGYEPPKITYSNYPDEINNGAIGAEVAYNFKAVYTDTEIAELKDKSIRHSILRGNNLYVLALDADNKPFVYIINADTHTLAKTLSTEGTDGSELALSDIQLTADGVLVGCSKALCQSTDGTDSAGKTQGEVNIYKWENGDDGIPNDDAPQKWITLNNIGNTSRAYVGNSMLYKGTVSDGTIVLTAENIDASVCVCNIAITIQDGKYVSDSYNNTFGGTITKTDFGEDYTICLSPIDEESLIISGSKHTPRSVAISSESAQYTDLPDGLISKPSAKVSFFKYAGHSYLVTGDEVEGKPIIKLIDITNGLDQARLIKTTFEENGVNSILASTGHTIVVKNDEDLVTEANIELVTLNANGTATKLTTANVEQPTPRAELAYDLRMTKNGSKYLFTFKSTGEAKKGEVILTRTDDNSKQIVIPISKSITKGENTKEVNALDLESGSYHWAVKLYSDMIGSPRVLFSDANKTSSRGGLTIVKDAESDAYCKIVKSEGKSGLNIYNPDFTLNKQDLFNEEFSKGNNSSPLRIAESNGTIYAADWSDSHSGIWMFDAANPTELTQFFEGTKDGTGAYLVNGEIIGGGATGVSFTGVGANRKMYTFLEDYPIGNNGNKLVRYDISEAKTWGKTPNAQFDAASALLPNTNVELIALENGVFASQVRAIGNNSPKAPGFLFMDNDGNIKFNSGVDMKDLTGCGSGIAIHNDIFAISENEKGIRVCKIYFNENNVPQFTTLYNIPFAASEHTQLAFDLAGNLYAYCRNLGLRVFSIPCEEPTATSVAKKDFILTGEASSINTPSADKVAQVNLYPNPTTDIANVEAREEITSIAIFNLVGTKVPAPTNIQGNKATIHISDLEPGAYIVKINKTAIRLIKN